MSTAKLEDIVSLCKRRGFIYPGSDVYGGLSGTWDYGPLGVALKRNVMQLWWKMFVEDRDDMFGVDAAILMNQKVWQASGHVDTFTDPLIECNFCHGRFRADHLIVDTEEYHKESNIFFAQREALINSYADKDYDMAAKDELISKLQSAGLIVGQATYPAHDTVSELRLFYVSNAQKDANIFLGDFPAYYLNKKGVKCARCGQLEWYPARTFNMMFKTNVGPVTDEDSISYLRPETAQGIFTNFKNVVDSFYPDLPFGLAQQGKAFRNEISPRDFIFRSREFEQMEIEYFVHPDDWETEFAKWIDLVHQWCDQLGLPTNSVYELEVPDNDRAHYSKRTIDFEFDFPIGREELLGLAYRTDFDLQNIQKASGKSMEYRPKDGSPAFVPHVIEPSFGLERAIMAVLTAAYVEDEVNGEKRTYLKLPKHLAPIKIAVSPLLKNKPELIAKAREVYSALKKEFGAVMWDDNGNIGKRYRRQDEIGTPYCVVIDFETLDDQAVTVRDRNTTNQQRVAIQDLITTLRTNG